MTNDSGETTEILGKTGQTVVYVFPQGVAYKSRNKQDLFSQLDPIKAELPTLLEAEPIAPEALIHRLVDRGQLTEGQMQVARYDQQTTGMNLVDALMARGWLSPDLLDGYLLDDVSLDDISLD